MPRLDGSAFADAMAEAQRKAGGGVRQRPRRQTAHEVALDCAAEAEMLAQQLRAIADAADLPPPEAFADTLDPSELPEPPFDGAELDAFMDDGVAIALDVASKAVPMPAQALEQGTTGLLRRSQSRTRVDFACRPTTAELPDASEGLKSALATLQRLSARMGRVRRR